MASRRRTQARTRAKKMRKLQDAGNPIAGKDLLHARKMLEKVCEIGCNFGPRFGISFGTSFGPRFGPYKYDLKERAPKLSQTWAQNCNQFRKLFQGMQQIFARYGVARVLCNFPIFLRASLLAFFRACSKSLPAHGVARVLQLSHFFARVLACVLRRLATSSYLGGSLNGRQACVGFEVPRTGPFAVQRCVPIAA